MQRRLVIGSLSTQPPEGSAHSSANVIGTTSSRQKAEIAKASGAEVVIVTSEEDTVKRVLDVTGGAGVHAVFDGIGKDT
jgi:NADPH:quinone reductase